MEELKKEMFNFLTYHGYEVKNILDFEKNDKFKRKRVFFSIKMIDKNGETKYLSFDLLSEYVENKETLQELKKRILKELEKN